MRSDVLQVVIAGGGVAALEGTLALRALAEERVAIELIAPETDFVYRPLSVGDPFQVAETRRFPLALLVEAAGAVLRRGRVTAVDPEERFVETDDGERVPYDALLVGLGARARVALPDALTFAGPESTAALRGLLDEALAGEVHRIVFALPGGVTWPLPLYELALLTATLLVDHGASGVEVALATPEEQPLAVFGREASQAVGELLAARGVTVHLRTTPARWEDGVLHSAPGDGIEADRVVALPRLEGPRLTGLPCDGDGFIPTDDRCRVGFEVDVFAAGDATQFPLKQGGIATQQADTAASEIAARAGAPVEPEPFKPVLRGLLLTGMVPRYLRGEPGTARSTVDTEALWWPPSKIVGRYLAPFLAAKLGLPEQTAARH
ncbi:MAG TPA: FAD/NAD(P)-binding oxidoreductase [Gaiellaceae bacterium]|nr:FAD/NAD(P)-binding oxidoreductase [Gaiellaceae bacterium]